MMQLVRSERKKLINAEAKAEAMGGGMSSGMTPGAIVAQQAKQNASLLEMEEKRMHKMKRRQEKVPGVCLVWGCLLADVC